MIACVPLGRDGEACLEKGVSLPLLSAGRRQSSAVQKFDNQEESLLVYKNETAKKGFFSKNIIFPQEGQNYFLHVHLCV